MTPAPFLLAGMGLRGRSRLGIAASFLVLALAAIGIAAGLVVSRQGAPVLDAAADDANVAHLVIGGDFDAVEQVAADPEVVAWSGPFATINDVELAIGGVRVPIELTALDTPDIEVNRPPVLSGRWATAADEVVLDFSLGDDLGLAVGDTITFQRSGTDLAFTIVGTGVNFTDCFYPACDPGRAWVTSDGLARFDAGDDVYAQAWLRFDDPAEADPFVERQAASDVEGIGGTNSWLDTRDDFLALDRVFGAFVSAFGVFVLVVAAVVIAGSTVVRIVARQREIGLLGAAGCTPRQIATGLLVENLAIGVVAGLVGWGVAGFLAPSLQLGIGRTLGPQDPSWSAMGLVVCIVAISVLLLVATLVPALSAARRPVTDVVRDVPRGRISWLNRRSAGMPARLPLMGAQEVASHPTRGFLAAIAITIAIVGAIVSGGFLGGIDAVASDPARAGDPWDLALFPGDVAPTDVEAALAESTAVAGWFTEVERRSTLDEGAFLSVATGGDPAVAAYRIAGGRSMAAAGEGIAGYGFLQRFDAAVGDRVAILAGTTAVEVTIVGWYRDTEDSGEILRYRMETLAAAEPGVRPSSYRIVIDEGARPEAVAAALTERLGNEARIEILDTGVSDLGPLLAVLWLIAVVLFVMAGANLLSTLLTASRESAGQFGVQVAVGFTPRQVIGQGAVGGAALGVVAAALGVPLGLWIFRVLADAVSSSIGVGPGWMPRPGMVGVVGLAAGAVVVSSVVGAVAVGRTTARPAADLLRAE